MGFSHSQTSFAFYDEENEVELCFKDLREGDIPSTPKGDIHDVTEEDHPLALGALSKWNLYFRVCHRIRSFDGSFNRMGRLENRSIGIL